MLRALLTWGWPVWLLAACSWAAGQESDREQEQVIATIKRMGGHVTTDCNRPGKPVVKIHLYKGKTAGVGLEPLTKLSEVDWIGLHASDISKADLVFLQRWPKLRRLGLVETRLTDASLENLRGITTLDELYLGENAITDAGLERLDRLTNLTILGIEQTKITDAGLQRLQPFQKLQWLRIDRNQISEAGLEHLRRLPNLKSLDLSGCRQVRSLKPLAGMPLVTLTLRECPVRDLSPLVGMPIASLDLFGCNEVHDLTPLAGMPLTEICLSPEKMTNGSLDVLRRCKTLRNITAGPGGRDRYTTQDFWKKFDAGEFRR